MRKIGLSKLLLFVLISIFFLVQSCSTDDTLTPEGYISEDRAIEIFKGSTQYQSFIEKSEMKDISASYEANFSEKIKDTYEWNQWREKIENASEEDRAVISKEYSSKVNKEIKGDIWIVKGGKSSKAFAGTYHGITMYIDAKSGEILGAEEIKYS